MGDIEQGKGAWLARKKLLSILASRNSTEADGKTLKSVKAMADIQGIDGLVRGLESDTKNGIPQSSVEKRLSTYGKNELADAPLPTYMELLGSLQDPIMLMLSSASVQLVLVHSGNERSLSRARKAIEPFIILVAVAVSNVAWNRLKKQKVARDEGGERNEQNERIPDGKLVDLMTSEIVVGDLVR